jgi:hypothetical protein
MKALWLTSSVLCASLHLTVAMPDDREPAPQVNAGSPTLAPPDRVASPGVAPIRQTTPEPSSQTAGAPEPAKFTTEAHWDTAGYNN